MSSTFARVVTVVRAARSTWCCGRVTLTTRRAGSRPPIWPTPRTRFASSRPGAINLIRRCNHPSHTHLYMSSITPLRSRCRFIGLAALRSHSLHSLHPSALPRCHPPSMGYSSQKNMEMRAMESPGALSPSSLRMARLQDDDKHAVQMLTPFAIPSTSQPSNPLTLSPPSSARADTRASQPRSLHSHTTPRSPLATAPSLFDRSLGPPKPTPITTRPNRSVGRFSWPTAPTNRPIVAPTTVEPLWESHPPRPYAHPTSAQAFLTSTTQTGRQPELSSAAQPMTARCSSNLFHPPSPLAVGVIGTTLELA